MHGGPVLLARHALTPEPVLLLQPLHPVLLVTVEEDGSVVLADLLALPDVLDCLDHHMVFHIVADDAGVARVIEQGQGRVNSWHEGNN